MRSPRADILGTGTQPLVSIVIPCYNQAAFLRDAIESALAQTYRRVEVIVIDDGSTDDTAAVADRYPVRWRRQPNRGVSAARNSGLAETRGEYVVFLDADDRLLPFAVQVGVETFGRHPECALVYGRLREIGPDGEPGLTQTAAPTGGNEYLALLRRNHIWTPGVVMYRRATFGWAGGFDPTVEPAEDYEFNLRVARGAPIHGHRHLVLERRRHAGNASADPARMLRAAVTVLRRERAKVDRSSAARRAIATGMRGVESLYGEALVSAVRRGVRQHCWGSVLGGWLVLARYYPRGFAAHGLRKAGRVVIGTPRETAVDVGQR
jgi:hypothetical protein